jgi:signal transduction histidine kinase
LYISTLAMKKFAVLVFCFFIFHSLSSQTKVDSLLQLCNRVPEKQKTNLFLELSFCTRTDSAKSNSYTRQALKLAEKHNQQPELAKATYYLGETNYYSRDYPKAIPQYQKAIPFFESLKDSFNLTNCYNSLGLCYHLIYQGDKAIIQFIKALRTCENDKEYTAEIISNIAMANEKMNNHRDAISNYKKALNLNTSIKDSASMAVNYNGLGDTYTNMSKPDSAIVNFWMAYNLFKKLKNTGYQAIAITNIAMLYPNYPDSLDKAIGSFNEASTIFKELGWNQFEPEIRQGMGLIYRNKGRYMDALNAFHESLDLANKLKKGFALKRTNYVGIAETYKLMGDYKTALKYHELFVLYNDSMVQKEKYEQIINLEKQYETEKKQNEIIRLQAAHELMDVQLQKNKQLKILGFVTASLLLIFVLFLLIRYFDKIKLNRLLEHKNQKIAQSENELKVLNASKNKFFSILAHDLKNPFHTVMGYSYLLSKDYDKFTEAERRKFASDIHHSTNNIFRLLQNLLEWSRSQTGRLIFAPREIELKQEVENALSVLHSLADQKNIRIECDFDDNLSLFADPQMIETVLRNLINNAIKFTPEYGLVQITANRVEDQVSICVKDSGIGISEEDARNLFQIDSTVKRKGTNNEDGSGLGLILCKEFVLKNNGNIWVNSSPGNGSSFFFTVPAKTGKSQESIENDSSQQLS